MKAYTWKDFNDALVKLVVKNAGITAEQAAKFLADPQVREIVVIGFNIQNTPKKVLEALAWGVFASAIKKEFGGRDAAEVA